MNNKKENKKKNTFVKIIYPISLLFYLFIIAYSLSKNETYYIFDSVIFIIIATFLYYYYEKWNMNPLSFMMANFAMSLHELGRFGFFGMQFFGINYDLITHFFACFAISNLLYFSLETRISSKEKNLQRIFPLLILLMCLGISCISEFMEFGGFLFIENGQGFLGIEPDLVYKGLIGVDLSVYGKEIQEIEAIKASIFDNYYDTMTDLLANAVGAIAGILSILFYSKLKRKR